MAESPINKNKGQILSELLIAIAIGVVLAAIGAQLVSVSLTASKSSKERQQALGLAQEGLETVRSIIRGNDASSQGWNRIYLPPDGTGNASTSKGISNPYYPQVVSNVWQLASGTETISLSGETYTRKIIIENVSRDSSGVIESNYNPTNDDPTTQKITVIISKTGSPDVQLSAYFTRFINESMLQTTFSNTVDDGPFSATSTTVSTCGQGTEINNLDLIGSPASLKLKQ